MLMAKQTKSQASTNDTDHALNFKLQKALTKKAARKLKPGDVVEVKWEDSPNTRAVVVEGLERTPRGHIYNYLRLFHFNTCDLSHENYDQVVAHVGRLDSNGHFIPV